jgi:hypothetical protein
MSKTQKSEPSPQLQLAGFLAKFAPEIAARAEEILIRLRVAIPHALELVYDNYNALAIGFSPTERASDAIVSIAVYPRWVSLFFLQAKGLPDPNNILKGQGNVAKHVVLPTPSALDEPAIQALMGEALNRAKTPMNPATTTVSSSSRSPPGRGLAARRRSSQNLPRVHRPPGAPDRQNSRSTAFLPYPVC